MIDVQAVHDTYKSQEISNVDFIRGPNNPANRMTKPSKCTPLHDLLRTENANFVVDQWVIRSTNTTIRSDTASSAFNAKEDSGQHH